jgi:hypothetical protein
MLDDAPQDWQRLYDISLPAGGKSQFWPQHPQQRRAERANDRPAATFDLEDNNRRSAAWRPIRDASKRIVAGISIASTVPYMPLEKWPS